MLKKTLDFALVLLVAHVIVGAIAWPLAIAILRRVLVSILFHTGSNGCFGDH